MIGFFLLSFYVLPKKTVKDTVVATLAHNEDVRYTTEENHVFYLTQYHPDLRGQEVTISYPYFFNTFTCLWVKTDSYNYTWQLAGSFSILRFILLACYFILMSIVFTLLNRDTCHRDNFKIILTIPLILLCFIGIFASALY